jgi:hypothetical protein
LVAFDVNSAWMNQVYLHGHDRHHHRADERNGLQFLIFVSCHQGSPPLMGGWCPDAARAMVYSALSLLVFNFS